VGNYNWPDRETVEEWHFNDAPRNLRIRAFEKIPDLFKKLKEESDSLAEEFVERAGEIIDLTTAVKALTGSKVGEQEDSKTKR
jgi:hypothetical protein